MISTTRARSVLVNSALFVLELVAASVQETAVSHIMGMLEHLNVLKMARETLHSSNNQLSSEVQVLNCCVKTTQKKVIKIEGYS